jgi:hypothetical protein
MIRRLLQRANRRVFFLGCLAGVILYGVGLAEDSRSYYCQRCGLTRTEHEKSWFGIPIHQCVRLHAGEASLLFRRFVSPRCEHRWRPFTHSWNRLLSSGVGCGRFPRWLYSPYDEALRPLGHFQDHSAVIAVLARIDPARDQSRDSRIVTALQELPPVPTRAQAAKWWTKHREMFGGGRDGGRDSDRQR